MEDEWETHEGSHYSNPYSNPEMEEEWETHETPEGTHYSNPYSNPEMEWETHEGSHYSNPYSNPEMEWEMHEGSHYSNPEWETHEGSHYSNPYSNPEWEDESDRFFPLVAKAATKLLPHAVRIGRNLIRGGRRRPAPRRSTGRSQPIGPRNQQISGLFHQLGRIFAQGESEAAGYTRGRRQCHERPGGACSDYTAHLPAGPYSQHDCTTTDRRTWWSSSASNNDRSGSPWYVPASPSWSAPWNDENARQANLSSRYVPTRPTRNAPRNESAGSTGCPPRYES